MHRTTDQFGERYRALPEDVRNEADKSFQLLKENSRHPSRLRAEAELEMRSQTLKP